jgi:hypothetical protein
VHLAVLADFTRLTEEVFVGHWLYSRPFTEQELLGLTGFRELHFRIVLTCLLFKLIG